MRNSPPEELTLTGAGLRLREVLPEGWLVKSAVGSGPLDGQLSITPPNWSKVTFDVELTRWTTAPTSQLRGVLADRATRTPRPILLVSDYLNAPMRRACEAQGIGYLDSMGWVLLHTEDPALFIRIDGRERPAPRVTHEVSRLNGIAAGRVIRTMLTIEPPVRVRELAQVADVRSAGSVSKILPTLVAADAIDRGEDGEVTQIRRRRLLERWTEDYSYLSSNGITLSYLAPRGLTSVLQRLGEYEGVCVTGSMAASEYLSPGTVPVVPTLRLALYADDPERIRRELDLHREDRSMSNVLITKPKDQAILSGQPGGTFRVAPLPQVLADLMTLPGRETALADQLMDQLALTDHRWAR